MNIYTQDFSLSQMCLFLLCSQGNKTFPFLQNPTLPSVGLRNRLERHKKKEKKCNIRCSLDKSTFARLGITLRYGVRSSQITK